MSTEIKIFHDTEKAEVISRLPTEADPDLQEHVTGFPHPVEFRGEERGKLVFALAPGHHREFTHWLQEHFRSR